MAMVGSETHDLNWQNVGDGFLRNRNFARFGEFLDKFRAISRYFAGHSKEQFCSGSYKLKQIKN
jgi:hypothetical protein